MTGVELAHPVEPAPSAVLVGATRAAGVGALGRVMIGYNHQIPHRGRVYHVQTEDSGRDKGHIHTHIFHAGAIVASARVDYDGSAPVHDINDLLKQSHKTMLRKLVRGVLDEAIARCLGRVDDRPQPKALAAGSPEAPQPPGEALAPPAAEAESSGSERTENEQGAEALRSLEHVKERLDMDNVKQTLETLKGSVTGTLGVALVDYESGMCLGSSGSGLNMDVAAAGNMEVMRAKSRVMRDLGIKGGIEDILITLQTQYHIIRPVGTAMFLYLAIDREQGNLAMARHKLGAAAGALEV